MIGKAPRAPLLKLDKADHFSVSIGYYSSPSYSFSDCTVEIVRTDCKNMDQFLSKHPRVQHITRTAICLTLLSVVECDPPYKSEYTTGALHSRPGLTSSSRLASLL